MKTKIKNFIIGVMYLVIAVSLFALSMMLPSCNEPKHQVTEVVVLWDITELHEPIPVASEILQLYNLDTNPENGAVLRFSYASDVSLNRETVFSLPPSGNSLITNQFDRTREIEKFKQDVTAFLDSITSDTVGRPQSSIYLPVATTLNELANNSQSDRKTFLLFSDLRENTQNLSFYDKHTLALVANDTAAITAILQSEMPLGNLSGIKVHLLYQPNDATDDTGYRYIAALYRGMLESKGASVFVSANLIQ